MPCTSPIVGVRDQDGRVRTRRGEFTKAAHDLGDIGLPCGRCLDCRIANQRNWALRCEHEAQFHRHPDGSSKTAFLTLTYDDDSVPRDLSVDIREWQLFAKRLRQHRWRQHRKQNPGTKTAELKKTFQSFRFLAVGEYGGERLRPHYHALLFGEDFADDRVKLYDKHDQVYYQSATLAQLWPNGIHYLQEMHPATINYVCRYTIDKIDTREVDQITERVDFLTGEVWHVNKPFATMSRRPGIGARWYEKWKHDVFPRDKVISQGREQPVPRYYSNKLKEENPELWEQISQERQKFTARQADQQTPERRLVRKKITKDKLRNFKQKRKLD